MRLCPDADLAWVSRVSSTREESALDLDATDVRVHGMQSGPFFPGDYGQHLACPPLSGSIGIEF